MQESINGGKLAEVVFRILQHLISGSHTPLGTSLPKTPSLLLEFEKASSAKFHDSLRIHIPRICQAIYDIRNRRGVGHVGGDVNPNIADATIVLYNSKWILIELVRLFYKTSLQNAQRLVDDLVVINFPVVQNFNGFLKVLSPHLPLPKKIILLLYERGAEGAMHAEIQEWTRKDARRLNEALRRLEHEQGYVHRHGDGRYVLTRIGVRYREEKLPRLA